MRWLVAALVTVLGWSTVQAQWGGAIGAAITPSPLGIVLTVGKWIYDSTSKKQVYYIEVAGQGNTPTEARDNGFRLAVEQAIGTLISSETEVQNGRIVRDEIVSYAAGFVDRFEITETRTAAAGTLVFMRVWIKRSDLADRLLNRSEQLGQVNGSAATVQLQTLNQERATGDRLLQQVLNDFPRRAFDIELSPTDIVRQNRSAHMEISFKINWNQHYLRSLWTALDAVSFRGSGTVSTIGVNSGGWFGFGGQARFDDMHKYQMLVNSMILSEPAVLVTVRGTGTTVLYSACYFYQELDHQARYGVTTDRFLKISSYEARAHVDGTYRMRSRIQIPISTGVLNQANSINLDVVPKRQCPN